MSSPRKYPTRAASKLVEILSIDTHSSRNLYKKAGLNPKEKSRAQNLLKAQFSQSCKLYGGKLHTWNGDGGFGFFPSDIDFGKSISAAKHFLANLNNLNHQTATSAEIAPSFARKVRIAAHRGEIYITKDTGIDSADPQSFDDFIKQEKKFAPELNDLFLTNELYNALPAKEKNDFQPYKKITAGSLNTLLYRMSIKPEIKTRNVLMEPDNKSLEVSPQEWTYLKSRITNHQRNIAARNLITKGLIHFILQRRPPGSSVSSKNLLELTLGALYNYVRSICDSEMVFRISFWCLFPSKQGEYLKILSYRYPRGEKPNSLNIKLPPDDLRFQVCRSFKNKEILATSCVESARLSGEWQDFDKTQKTIKRALRSAIQIPVYYRNLNGDKIMQGVLCMDSDKSDTFISGDIALWADDLVSYLVNIALSEMLRSDGV